MFRGSSVLFPRWKSTDFLHGRNKKRGAVHVRHVFGWRGHKKPWTRDHSITRDGLPGSRNQWRRGAGIRLGGGGGLFGNRRCYANLKDVTPEQYQLFLYGHPHITNAYHGHQDRNPDLQEATQPFGFEMRFFVPHGGPATNEALGCVAAAAQTFPGLVRDVHVGSSQRTVRLVPPNLPATDAQLGRHSPSAGSLVDAVVAACASGVPPLKLIVHLGGRAATKSESSPGAAEKEVAETVKWHLGAHDPRTHFSTRTPHVQVLVVVVPPPGKDSPPHAALPASVGKVLMHHGFVSMKATTDVAPLAEYLSRFRQQPEEPRDRPVEAPVAVAKPAKRTLLHYAAKNKKAVAGGTHA